MQKICIDNREIGLDQRPYIIAEMSCNHNQSLDRALALVEEAAEAGADAIKLQTFLPDDMTLNLQHNEFMIHDKNSLWHGKSLYELYQQASMPWEWHAPIMQHAKKMGISCFSSPFSEQAVDFLQELDVPCFKIASFESNHVPLLRKVAGTGKPVIVSTGMATIEDIDLIVATLREAGCEQFILMKCTSEYPATFADCNLKAIPYLADRFKCLVGLSDHTLGTTAPIAGVALGACVVEKHVTLNRADGGLDSAFSLEPPELSSLVQQTHHAWQSLGSSELHVSEREKKSQQFRRSIYFSNNLAVGDVIGEQDIKIIRPGYGLHPKHYDDVIGRKVTADVEFGTAVSWEVME